MKRNMIALGVVVLLLLTGCSVAGPESSRTSQGESASTAGGSTLLADFGLDGMDGKQIVDHLDRVPVARRSADLVASVRADHVVLADGVREVRVPLGEDRFYLSVAPYVDRTHDCVYHSLTTCRGELAGKEVRVRAVDDVTGEVLVEERTTTFDNGFVGFWLPRGVNGSIEVAYGDLTGRSAFSTTEDGATCLTTLRLTEG
ncbi:hypothetical protein SacxiDRAFT_4176 [Saccharomonospora xinjiangensis XJ-54]|uniref:Lipoprotein n=2 Tax=Saccharomonospora TaxID=1851 RepID=I0V8A5_9PSEU|nr:hypothetical protein SacxiDRAFT_4176 [Saccharomonospora xinjiangensis XJ-54]